MNYFSTIFYQIDSVVYASMLLILCHYHLGDVEGTEIEFQCLRGIRSGMSYPETLHLKKCPGRFWEYVLKSSENIVFN
jgi:hypothetical protein